MEKLKKKNLIKRIVIAAIIFVVTCIGLTTYNMYQQYKKNKKIAEETMWSLGNFYLGQLIMLDDLKTMRGRIDFKQKRKIVEIHRINDRNAQLTTSSACELFVYAEKVEDLPNAYKVYRIEERELGGSDPLDDIVLDYYNQLKELYQYIDNKRGIYTNDKQTVFFFTTDKGYVIIGDFMFYGSHMFTYCIVDSEHFHPKYDKLVLLEE